MTQIAMSNFDIDAAQKALVAVKVSPDEGLAPHLDAALTEIETLRRSREEQTRLLRRAVDYHTEMAEKMASVTQSEQLDAETREHAAYNARDHAQMANAILSVLEGDRTLS